MLGKRRKRWGRDEKVAGEYVAGSIQVDNLAFLFCSVKDAR